MKRGSKEFKDVQSAFERIISNVYLGYMSSDLSKDDSNTRCFYANGEINRMFKAYMAGYAAAKLEYQE